MYTVPTDTKIIGTTIKEAIEYNEKMRGRFDKLDMYYIGEQSILDRVRASGDLFNNKVIINHAKYIVDIFSGYLLGNPVGYQVKDGDIQPVLDTYDDQTISDLDSDLAEDCSIFGRSYEYVFANEDAKPMSVQLDVRNTIVAYDNTVKHKKMFAINYEPVYEKQTDKKPSHYEVMVVDSKEIHHYKLANDNLTETSGKEDHVFGDVPVIEYPNNRKSIGDFEQVITLIDAYNIVQSDRVNDREQLADAILAIYGADFTKEQLESLRTLRMISQLPPDAKAEYVVKNVSEEDIDVLRKNIETDIFKISMAPNMTDDNFVGNSSGVAISYKLLPFEQATKKKERRFERGLKERYELYKAFLGVKSKMKDVPAKHVNTVFTRSLPKNDFETSQMINNLIGTVDDEQLVGQLSFIRDAKETVKKAKAQKDAEVANSKYGTDEPESE